MKSNNPKSNHTNDNAVISIFLKVVKIMAQESKSYVSTTKYFIITRMKLVK
ncbi:hypothetical protein [Spiroplasma poulsonii]|uniref:hypothetical protein n=1 Tax=Spiroplasma poulsonii TaxID=2138 RepID=UPI001F4D1CDE|nr:hypothetical protein [Spiroplasma poulsonii]UNF61612.1 hypothetical protein MNU24_06790 [Spiroplasma poulsonii]